MNPATISLLLFTAVASLVATVLMIKNLRGAPEGYEDENGFHYGRFAQEMVRANRHQEHAEVHEHQTAA